MVILVDEDARDAHRVTSCRGLLCQPCRNRSSFLKSNSRQNRELPRTKSAEDSRSRRVGRGSHLSGETCSLRLAYWWKRYPETIRLDLNRADRAFQRNRCPRRGCTFVDQLNET